MRIVYVITRADEIGGAQVHVRDLATAMQEAGHDVLVVAGIAGSLFEELSKRGVLCQAVPALVRQIAPWRDVVAVQHLWALLRRFQPDLVSTHSSKAGWLGRLASRTLGVPVLFTAHGWAFTEGVSPAAQQVYALAERLAAPLADRIITVSEYDRRLALAKRIAPPQKIISIHNGVPGLNAAAAARRRAGPPRIIMTSRFAPQKDHGTLLRSLSQLQELDWVLDLVGEGPDRDRVAALATSLGIKARSNLLGVRRDVPALLDQADIYTLISNWEGLPYGILEAMSAGLPVVASDVGGVSEAVIDGHTGFLTPRGNANTLTDRLRRLLLDTELRRTLGAAGRQRYWDHFRFDHMFKRTLAVYDEARHGGQR